MENLLIVLGAAAALGGFAWLGYVGSVMKGPKGNALVGGVSSLVVGAAVIFLGASISDDSGQSNQIFPSGSGFATATPGIEPTATPELAPEELYRQEANDLAARAGNDLARVILLLSTPDAANAIWVNDVRQTGSQFARYVVRARDLAPTEEQAEVQELLMAVLSDLSTAGRQVNNSLDAIGFQNVTAAQDAINEALRILRDSSPVLVEIVTRTAPEES